MNRQCEVKMTKSGKQFTSGEREMGFAVAKEVGCKITDLSFERSIGFGSSAAIRLNGETVATYVRTR